MVAPHRTTTPSRGGGSCNVTVRDRSFECQVVQSVNVLSLVAVSLQSRFKSARRWEGIVCGGSQVVWLWFPRWGSNKGRKTSEEERCSGWKDSQGVGWYWEFGECKRSCWSQEVPSHFLFLSFYLLQSLFRLVV